MYETSLTILPAGVAVLRATVIGCIALATAFVAFKLFKHFRAKYRAAGKPSIKDMIKNLSSKVRTSPDQAVTQS